MKKLHKYQYGSVNNVIVKITESDYDQNGIDHFDYEEEDSGINDGDQISFQSRRKQSKKTKIIMEIW